MPFLLVFLCAASRPQRLILAQSQDHSPAEKGQPEPFRAPQPLLHVNVLPVSAQEQHLHPRLHCPNIQCSKATRGKAHQPRGF